MSEEKPFTSADMAKDTEAFWKGQFGNEYNGRNVNLVENNTAFFAKALQRTNRITHLIEFGAGTGQNLTALHRLLPYAKKTAVEINEEAANVIKATCPALVDIFYESIFTFDPSPLITPDLAITKGLLIHIHPNQLVQAYRTIYASTKRYILLAEYYAPRPTMIPYRGFHDRMWKNDFAGDMLAIYPDLRLIDYGFQYHRDPLWPQDDINYFLMEKR